MSCGGAHPAWRGNDVRECCGVGWIAGDEFFVNVLGAMCATCTIEGEGGRTYPVDLDFVPFLVLAWFGVRRGLLDVRNAAHAFHEMRGVRDEGFHPGL